MSAGFSAQDLAPGPLLFGWVIGAVLALCGVVAYAEVARLRPRSGGEYRYLSELWHPFLGYLAGWTSLLIGFSAPVAVDAYAAGAFAQKLIPSLSPELFAVVAIAVLTVVHAIGLRSSARIQNGLFAVKVALLAASAPGAGRPRRQPPYSRPAAGWRASGRAQTLPVRATQRQPTASVEHSRRGES